MIADLVQRVFCGSFGAAVVVVDIFGNDTMQTIVVTVPNGKGKK